MPASCTFRVRTSNGNVPNVLLPALFTYCPDNFILCALAIFDNACNGVSPGFSLKASALAPCCVPYLASDSAVKSSAGAPCSCALASVSVIGVSSDVKNK